MEAAIIVALTTLHLKLEPVDQREPTVTEFGTALHCVEPVRVRVHPLAPLTETAGAAG